MRTPSYISTLPDKAWRNHWPRKVAVMGCTGSIGVSTLEIIRSSGSRLQPYALACGVNIQRMAEQANAFLPPYLGILHKEDEPALKRLLAKSYSPTIVYGQEGFEYIASLANVDIVVSAQSGASGLRSTVAAAKAGKVIALANKESLVIAGHLIRSLCSKTGAIILPVDSEHNAIFQCLNGEKLKDVHRMILTASGGPFFGKTYDELLAITPEKALAHPNWSMGKKISIDSATLMNKGLEVIEACHLFGLTLEQIDVVIHRQSIVHSLVEFNDSSQIAELGLPDMRVAISHALNYPERTATGVGYLDLATVGTLTFAKPDEASFPALNLAKKAFNSGYGHPVVLNAVNEIAVEHFLNGSIPFVDIAEIVSQCLGIYEKNTQAFSYDLQLLDDLLGLDAWARKTGDTLIASAYQGK